MSGPVLRSARPVTLLGGGELDPRDLATALRLAPRLVAADAGAGAALRLGHLPDAVIGDFDSLAEEDRRAIPAERLHRVAEQETTDFDKCLRLVEAPLFLCLGFTGARVDHELAVYNALVRHGTRRALVIGGADLCCHADREMTLTLAPGSRLSLFPLAPVTGRSEGLEWPIEGLHFAPGGRIGTSNRVTGPVRLAFDAPGMLVILPKTALPAVLASWGQGAAAGAGA